LVRVEIITFTAMIKPFTIFVGAALLMSSCTSVFWVKNVEIPAEKVLTTREIQLEVFDAAGVCCNSMDVEITTTNQGESAVITEFKVPKFSSVNRRPTRVNYLWMVDGQDTSVYELVYERKRDWAIFSTVGSGLVLAAIPLGVVTRSVDVGFSSFLVGYFSLVYGGVFIDLPTGVASLVADMRAKQDGLQRSWKLKGVRTLAPADYPPALVYGISKLALEPEPSSESKGALEGRITQP
jgi:hypothetical protein